MQFRINQFRNQGHVVSKDAKIFDSHVRDAIIVRRAVTLGLPVHLVGNLKGEESVKDDYANIAQELIGGDITRETHS